MTTDLHDPRTEPPRSEPSRNGPARTEPPRSDRIAGSPALGLAYAVTIASLWALVAATWTPRGPLTTSTALWSILISLSVGTIAGFLMRSRWAMLLAPATFAAVFEFARMPVTGPMVDGVHASMYGGMAFVTGRGVHALLALLPLALGASVGAGVARSRLPDLNPRVGAPSRRWTVVLRRTGAVVTAVALLALAAAIARPASTDPIVGPDGIAIPGSVAELTTVEVGGQDLRLMIRGTSMDNPVVLFLAGGPGGSEIGAMRRHLQALEQHFTVVTWDQRGAGTAYPELDPTDTVALDGYVSDTIALTEYLRERFAVDDVYLLGQSWGTTLGVLAVQQRPELYRAFIGTGQMVSQRATDEIFYDDTLAWALRTGDEALAAELREVGPPPYDEMFPYETALSHEQAVYPYDHSGNSEGAGQMSENLLVEEYTLIDQVHIIGAFLDTFAALYPQLQGIDFRESATEFEVPMFFVQGAHEAGGRAELFAEWYPMVQAPAKDLTVLDTSGHRPLWEQPAEFVDYMVGTVLEQTS